jgi:hypothetical protein
MTTKQWAEYQRQADVIEQEQKRKENMTAVEWLFHKYKLQDEKILIDDYYQAREMEKQQMEISDEEIETLRLEHFKENGIWSENSEWFIKGAKWYREQLKQK